MSKLMYEQANTHKHTHNADTVMVEDRYYVQFLTPQVFLVRERSSAPTEPGQSDRLVRSFELRQDASMYVNTLNEAQRKLDELYGRWVQSAV